MEGSKQVQKVDAKKLTQAGEILNKAASYLNKNASKIASDSSIFSKWFEVTKSLGAKLPGEETTEERGGIISRVDAILKTFEEGSDEQKTEYVFSHPEIFDTLPKLYNFESIENDPLGKEALSAAKKNADKIIKDAKEKTQKIINETEGEQREDDSTKNAAGLAGMTALEQEDAQASKKVEGEQKTPESKDTQNVENSEQTQAEPESSNPTPEKESFFKRNKHKLVIWSAAAAAAIVIAFGINEFSTQRNGASIPVDSTKVEQVVSAPLVSVDSIITSARMNTGPTTTLSTGDTVPHEYNNLSATGLPKSFKSNQQKYTTVSDLAAKIKEVKQKQTKQNIDSKRFEIVDGAYYFDMNNPQNAKLAHRYGISGFVKYAMQDAQSFSGIDSKFMDLVDSNCNLNLGVSLKSCDTWHRSDLKLANTVVISLDRTQDAAPSTQETNVVKPQSGQKKDTTNTTTIDSTNVNPELNCDAALYLLGVDECEQFNVFMREDGLFHIKYDMVDSPHYLDDSTVVNALRNCDMVVDLPDFNNKKQVNGSTIIFQSTTITFGFRTDTTLSDTTQKKLEDKLKGAASLQKNTDEGEDKAKSLLNKSTLHKK